MEFFDAYEEVFSAIERFAEEHGHAPKHVSVSPTLYRWLLEMKRESVTLQLEDFGDVNTLNTRFGSITIIVDEMLDPYEILVD